MSQVRQLFLSKRLVTENDVFDGAVLVNENGIIEKVINRGCANEIIKESAGTIKVN